MLPSSSQRHEVEIDAPLPKVRGDPFCGPICPQPSNRVGLPTEKRQRRKHVATCAASTKLWISRKTVGNYNVQGNEPSADHHGMSPWRNGCTIFFVSSITLSCKPQSYGFGIRHHRISHFVSLAFNMCNAELMTVRDL